MQFEASLQFLPSFHVPHGWSTNEQYRKVVEGTSGERREAGLLSLRSNRLLVSGRGVPYYKFDSSGVTALGGPCCRLLSYESCPFYHQQPFPFRNTHTHIHTPRIISRDSFLLHVAPTGSLVWRTNLKGGPELGQECTLYADFLHFAALTFVTKFLGVEHRGNRWPPITGA